MARMKRTTGRGLGEKVGQFYVKKPFRKSFTPGGSTEDFETLAGFITPPLVVPKRAWLQIHGVQLGSDEITATGMSAAVFGATEYTGFNLDDTTNVADYFRPNIGDDDDYDTQTPAEDLALVSVGSNDDEGVEGAGQEWWYRRVWNHNFNSAVISEANKVRHFFNGRMGGSRGRRLRELDTAHDFERPHVVWLGAACGVRLSESATDQDGAFLGSNDNSVADLYRDLISQMGAYRNADANSAVNALFGNVGLDPAVERYLSSGSEYYTNITDDQHNLTEDFVVFGKLTVRCDLFAGARNTSLSVKQVLI